jgi:hypothetical protein
MEKAVKSILNKLAPTKFDKLSAEACQIRYEQADSMEFMGAMVTLLFDKALVEQAFQDLFARLCFDIHTHEQKIGAPKKLLVALQERCGADEGFCKKGEAGEANSATTLEERIAVGVKAASFRRLLLNKCGMEFEKGQQWAGNDKDDGEGEEDDGLDDNEREEVRVKSKMRALGNMAFVGQLVSKCHWYFHYYYYYYYYYCYYYYCKCCCYC